MTKNNKDFKSNYKKFKWLFFVHGFIVLSISMFILQLIRHVIYGNPISTISELFPHVIYLSLLFGFFVASILWVTVFWFTKINIRK